MTETKTTEEWTVFETWEVDTEIRYKEGRFGETVY